MNIEFNNGFIEQLNLDLNTDIKKYEIVYVSNIMDDFEFLMSDFKDNFVLVSVNKDAIINSIRKLHYNFRKTGKNADMYFFLLGVMWFEYDNVIFLDSRKKEKHYIVTNKIEQIKNKKIAEEDFKLEELITLVKLIGIKEFNNNFTKKIEATEKKYVFNYDIDICNI